MATPVEVRVGDDGRVRVVVDCAFGALRGVWRAAAVPVVGHLYHVELTIPGTLAHLRVRHAEPEYQVLAGVVDGVDEDGMIYLRLATDCLTMVEALPGEAVVGQELSIHVPDSVLEIWPFGV